MDGAQVAVADYRPVWWPAATELLIRRVRLDPEQVADLAEQATDALLKIKDLVETAAVSGTGIDVEALAHHTGLLRSAVVLRKTATSGRATKLERASPSWPRRSIRSRAAGCNITGRSTTPCCIRSYDASTPT
jgi:hypothetical protein